MTFTSLTYRAKGESFQLSILKILDGQPDGRASSVWSIIVNEAGQFKPLDDTPPPGDAGPVARAPPFDLPMADYGPPFALGA
jgi:hypothetical protein